MVGASVRRAKKPGPAGPPGMKRGDGACGPFSFWGAPQKVLEKALPEERIVIGVQQRA